MKYLAQVLLFSLSLAAGVGSVTEAGSITSYTDRTVFVTAMGVPLSVETFTDDYHFPIATGVLNSATDTDVDYGSRINAGDILPGVTYSTPIRDGFFFNIDSGAGYEGGFLDGFLNDGADNSLSIAFDQLVSGFGFDTNFMMGDAFTMTIHFARGADAVLNVAVDPEAPDFLFFGFQSDATDITGATILGSGSYPPFAFALDNFTFPQPSVATPEPSTLIAASLAGLAALARGRLRRTRA